jgi:hypothetical protein
LLLLQMIVGVLVYGGLSLALKPEAYLQMVDMLKAIRGRTAMVASGAEAACADGAATKDASSVVDSSPTTDDGSDHRS